MMTRCPYCSAGILAPQAFCSACGRPLTSAAAGSPNQAGMPAPLMPASLASPGIALYPPPTQSPWPSSSPTQTVKEKRHHWIWLGNLITIGIGGWIIYAHWQGTVGLGVAIALLALSALSLGLSRFGARWQRASCLEKLLILPGVLAGLIVFVAIVLSGSDSDSSSSHSSSHSSSDHSSSGHSDSSDADLFDSSDSSQRGRQPNRWPFQSCPRCGQIVPPGMRACPRCGLPLP